MKLLEGKKAKLMSPSKKRRKAEVENFYKRSDFKHIDLETLLLKLSFALSSDGQLRKAEEIVSCLLWIFLKKTKDFRAS